MDDELEALLRDHYRRAAEEIHADPALLRRYRAAARPGADGTRTPNPLGKGLGLRRWALPVLAAAATAAVVLAAAMLLWRSPQPAPPQPAAPPSPAATTTPPPAPTPSRASTRPPVPESTARPRSARSSAPAAPDPASTVRPEATGNPPSERPATPRDAPHTAHDGSVADGPAARGIGLE
ncbi:hypothetical protein Acsp04_33520 [Actinomadura sp. NBRC 104425]|uniref:hypothetical protein n=1 Tax=Actinomadura sp. NBRC 104425 TaxID=3032204 RepID=UPI0024A5F47C|nr:hypothetical protein [Actinomadura sp. NBRC 104425]GLZ13117.1 hypothetical protein Acsp04_33520 [Actinomadura sp. NBRC 104425]